MTSKKSPELSYLNLRIIQSIYIIRIDQTSHIQDTIIAQWFTDASDKFNSAPTIFKSYSTFGIYLAETLPCTSDKIHLLEKRYLGKFSSHIGKNLHIMQYTCTDIMYDVKRCPISTSLTMDQSPYPLPICLTTQSHHISLLP